jgi:hypothetical protein
MKTPFYITSFLKSILFLVLWNFTQALHAQTVVINPLISKPKYELIVVFDSNTHIDTITKVRNSINGQEIAITYPSEARLWQVQGTFPVTFTFGGVTSTLNNIGDAVERIRQNGGVSGASNNYPIAANPLFPSCPYGIGNETGDKLMPYCNRLIAPIPTFSNTNSIKIAILDSGLSNSSYFNNLLTFSSLVSSGTDYSRNSPYASPMTSDNFGHGTKVASVIAWYMKRITNNCQIIPIKVLNAFGNGTAFQAIQGIDEANNQNVNIINMSFIGIDSFGQHTPPFKPTPMEIAKNKCNTNNILTFEAAGNDNTNIDATVTHIKAGKTYKVIYSPANLPNANSIVVGSYGCGLMKSDFSNYGNISVDVFAPGENIFTIDHNGNKHYSSGTSFATPIVSAIAALIKLQNPLMSLSAWRAAILNYGQTLTALSPYSVSSGVATTNNTPVTKNELANAGPDVTIDCNASLPVTLCATPNQNYLWNTSQSSQCISVNPHITTTYAVTVTGNPDTCHIVDSVRVIRNCLTVNSLVLKHVTCNGGNDGKAVVFLQTVGTIVNYRWSNGATSQVIDNLLAGVYTCTVTDINGNSVLSSVTITEPAPLTVNAGADITLCSNVAATLTAQGKGSFLWSTGQTTRSISIAPTVTTTYSVTLTNNNGCTAIDDITVTIIPCGNSVVLNAMVRLSNFNINTLLMDNYLTTLPDFPTIDPYASLPLSVNYTHVNNNQIASILPTILNQSGSGAVIDWAFIELRVGASGATTVVYTKSALLLANGKIVATDGVSPVAFPNAPSGNYYVAIRHRNHLGFRTSNTIDLNNVATVRNFTNNSILLYGITPLSSNSSMIAADASADGSIDAADSAIWEGQNGRYDEYSLSADYNMDGSVDAIDSGLWEQNNGSYQELD